MLRQTLTGSEAGRGVVASAAVLGGALSGSTVAVVLGVMFLLTSSSEQSHRDGRPQRLKLELFVRPE